MPFICQPPSRKSAAFGIVLRYALCLPTGNSYVVLTTKRCGTSCEETDFSHFRQYESCFEPACPM